MLNALLRYAESHNLEAEPGFEPKTVRWGIKLDESGRFLERRSLGRDERGRGTRARFPEVPRPLTV